MELELRKLEDNIRSIHEEMFYLRERHVLNLKKTQNTVLCFAKFITSHLSYTACYSFREVEMQELNRRTNSRMAWLGFLSLAICLSVAGLQLWHLKNFFERKKLL